MPVEYFHWRRSANAMDLLDLESGITPWTGTEWQRDLFPAEYHDDFLVLHEGIDTRTFTPKQPRARLVAGHTLAGDTRVVTFVARNLDRLRGFDLFMELANRLMRRYPELVCIVVGGTISQRGLDFQFFNKDFRADVLRQHPPHDPQRFWQLGSVPHATVAEVLAASDLHVYASRPYAISRSLLEAQASGCVVMAADTEPVREVLTNGQTGLLVAPHDLDAWEKQACAVLDNPSDYRPLRETAVDRVRERFAQDVTLPRLATRFDQLVERGGKA
jgi:glycosyltransferase involved in cell wall biosynthesis